MTQYSGPTGKRRYTANRFGTPTYDHSDRVAQFEYRFDLWHGLINYGGSGLKAEDVEKGRKKFSETYATDKKPYDLNDFTIYRRSDAPRIYNPTDDDAFESAVRREFQNLTFDPLKEQLTQYQYDEMRKIWEQRKAYFENLESFALKESPPTPPISTEAAAVTTQIQPPPQTPQPDASPQIPVSNPPVAQASTPRKTSRRDILVGALVVGLLCAGMGLGIGSAGGPVGMIVGGIVGFVVGVVAVVSDRYLKKESEPEKPSDRRSNKRAIEENTSTHKHTPAFAPEPSVSVEAQIKKTTPEEIKPRIITPLFHACTEESESDEPDTSSDSEPEPDPDKPRERRSSSL